MPLEVPKTERRQEVQAQSAKTSRHYMFRENFPTAEDHARYQAILDRWEEDRRANRVITLETPDEAAFYSQYLFVTGTRRRHQDRDLVDQMQKAEDARSKKRGRRASKDEIPAIPSTPAIPLTRFSFDKD